MKIIYFGTDVFFSAFAWLMHSEHEVTELYTYYEPEEYIRNEKVTALAKQYQIPIHYERIQKETVINLFQTGQCDLLISAEYDAKIPTPDFAEFRGINIHNSLLPEGRGYFPIEMRIFQGYTYGGITLHKLAEQFDTGDILLQTSFPIDSKQNERAVYAKCDLLAVDLLRQCLQNFQQLWYEAKPQPQGGSYWKKPRPEDYTISTGMCVEEIVHIYRSFGRFTKVRQQQHEYKVEHIETMDSAAWKQPGICLAKRKTLDFMARDGVVKIHLQEEL